MKVKIKEIFDKQLDFDPNCTLGLDLGSRSGKAVLLYDGDIYMAITPAGYNPQQTANILIEKISAESGVKTRDIQYIIGTGYGRISINFGDIPLNMITEISCHAMGNHYLNRNTKTIIDIGGQDSKVIRVDSKDGKIIEFLMNDKCAAGTGRFLEKAALMVGIPVERLGELSLSAEKPSGISSQCIVYAESEIISLKAMGESPGDIIAGIHEATARRIKTLLNKIKIEPEIIFSGGVSNNTGMRKALEKVLGFKIPTVKIDATYAGALGAAIFAARNAERKKTLISFS